MGDKSSIQWTDATRTFERVSGGKHWTGVVELIEDKLADPLRWKKPRRVFVNSMSDFFHEKVDLFDIARMFDVMASEGGHRHTYQVLTKRAARMHEVMTALPDYVAEHFAGDSAISTAMEVGQWPLPNVWLGVSVENQAAVDERIPLLLQTPAAIRFLSVEPLLGPVDLSTLQPFCRVPIEPSVQRHLKAMFPHGLPSNSLNAQLAKQKIDWVIVGGESGPGARPCDLAWIRDIVDQCRAAATPCFVKQLGADAFDSDRTASGRSETVTLRDRKGGDMSEWPEDLRVREFPSP